MKLYVCHGTFRSPRPGGHPCRNAYMALTDAGHSPEVIKAGGWALLPEMFNSSAGRKRVKELTGTNWVPALELDDGTAIDGSQNIIDWARAHPAGAAAA